MISESECLFWDQIGAVKQGPGDLQRLKQVLQLKILYESGKTLARKR